MSETSILQIPVYVRRSLDIMLDTNGYPHTEGNRQAMYAEIIKNITEEDLGNINELALEDHNFIDNVYSDAVSEAFDYCENNELFRVFKENEETDIYEEDNLPGCCYDTDFFTDINSPWPESNIKD